MFGICITYGLAIVGILLYTIYKWGTSTFEFFVDKGIPFKQPSPFIGSVLPVLLKKRTLHENQLDLYNDFKDKKFIGVFHFRSPVIMLRDPELIRQVAVKDFDHFVNHRDFLFTEEVDPLFGKSMFMLKDQKWRDMRATLSPAFTGSKIRKMFQLVVECAQGASEIMLHEAKLKEKSDGDKKYVPELKDVFTRCTIDVIATIAFGVQVNSLKDRDNEFYRMGVKTTNFTVMSLFRGLFITKFPKFAKYLGITFFEPALPDFFRSLVMDSMKERQAHSIIRPDMIQLLMDAKRGALRDEDSNKKDADGFATVADSAENQSRGNANRVWTDDDYSAQCFLFFLGGFESSSTLLCVAVHELMANSEVQDQLRSEIDLVREKLNGQPLTYEILQKMTYMDMVISEALRMWSPFPQVDRMCTKRYEMIDESFGTRIVLEKGDGIWIPIHGLHRDPAYFPNPDVFDPERFSEENRGNIRPYTYLPFGVGPRSCIGSRLALMEAKTFLFYLMSNFTFERAANSQIPLRIIRNGFQSSNENGFNVHLKPRGISGNSL